MKNKNLNIILLLAVAFIWGGVIIRFFGNFFSGSENQDDYFVENERMVFPKNNDRNFVLQANYRDPFNTKGLTSNEFVKKNTSNNIKTYQTKKQTTPSQWPSMMYYGYIRENKKNKGLVVIKINNLMLNLRKGDEFYTYYKVKETYRDSVIITKGKEHKILYRNK